MGNTRRRVSTSVERPGKSHSITPLYGYWLDLIRLRMPVTTECAHGLLLRVGRSSSFKRSAICLGPRPDFASFLISRTTSISFGCGTNAFRSKTKPNGGCADLRSFCPSCRCSCEPWAGRRTTPWACNVPFTVDLALLSFLAICSKEYPDA